MRNKVIQSVVFYAVATGIALTFLLPLAWMISTSLRTPGLPPPRSVEWIPQPIAWDNYLEIFQALPFGRYFLNSFLVSTMAVLLTLLTASLAGFGMSQLNRKRRRWLVIFSVGLLMVPVTALWLARFVLFRYLGWIDTYMALISPAIMGSSPLFILLFYWAFRRLPIEYYDYARLEGASPLKLWRMVAIPLSKTTVLVVSILTFIFYWNDFINPLLYLKSQRLYTLAVGLQQLQQLDRTNWPLLLAASVVTTLPILLLFLVLQRYYLADESS